MKNGEPNLMELLSRIPDQYSDFLTSIAVIIKNYQIGDEVRDYLLEHPNASTDNVIDYIYDELVEE